MSYTDAQSTYDVAGNGQQQQQGGNQAMYDTSMGTKPYDEMRGRKPTSGQDAQYGVAGSGSSMSGGATYDTAANTQQPGISQYQASDQAAFTSNGQPRPGVPQAVYDTSNPVNTMNGQARPGMQQAVYDTSDGMHVGGQQGQTGTLVPQSTYDRSNGQPRPGVPQAVYDTSNPVNTMNGQARPGMQQAVYDTSDGVNTMAGPPLPVKGQPPQQQAVYATSDPVNTMNRQPQDGNGQPRPGVQQAVYDTSDGVNTMNGQPPLSMQQAVYDTSNPVQLGGQHTGTLHPQPAYDRTNGQSRPGMQQAVYDQGNPTHTLNGQPPRTGAQQAVYDASSPQQQQQQQQQQQAVYDRSNAGVHATMRVQKTATLNPEAAYDRSNAPLTDAAGKPVVYDNTLPRGSRTPAVYDSADVAGSHGNPAKPTVAVYDTSSPTPPQQQQQQQAVYNQSAPHNIVYTSEANTAASSGYHVANPAVPNTGGYHVATIDRDGPHLYESSVDPYRGHGSRKQSFEEPPSMYDSAHNHGGLPGSHDNGTITSTVSVNSQAMYDNFDGVVKGGKHLIAGADLTYDTADGDLTQGQPGQERGSDVFDNNAFVIGQGGLKVASVRRSNPMYRDSRMYQDTGAAEDPTMTKEHVV